MSDFNIVAYGKSDFNDIIRLAKKAGFKCKKIKKANLQNALIDQETAYMRVM